MSLIWLFDWEVELSVELSFKELGLEYLYKSVIVYVLEPLLDSESLFESIIESVPGSETLPLLLELLSLKSIAFTFDWTALKQI